MTVRSIGESVEQRRARLFAKAMEGKRLAEPVAPPNIIMSQYGVASGRPTAIQAYGGVGKTYLGIDLAISVAAGDPLVWGISMYEGGARNVLYLDYELGEKLIKRRFLRLASGRGIDLAALWGDRLRVISHPLEYMVKGSEALWRDACEGVFVCIIDHYRSAAQLSTENDPSAAAALDMMNRISDATGTVFVVMFHENKPTEARRESRYAMRGHSSQFDACGCVLKLQPGESGNGEDVIFVEHTKSGFGKKGAVVQIKFVDEGDGETTWGLPNARHENRCRGSRS